VTEPLEVARSFCGALDTGDWHAITALTDAESLHDFAEERLAHARSLERGAGNRKYAGPPDAPPEVRRWLTERAERGLALSSLAEDFAGVQTVAELESLTPEQVAARALQGLFARTLAQIARAWLGVVTEDEDRVHAVYRARFLAAPDEEGTVAILSMRRSAAGWRVLWDGHGPFGLPGFGAHMYMVGRARRNTDPSA
jgi:hypothetical protein